ncbi:hypothetical protein [Candidatus Electronema sp. JC]|uniref:hypothetical protein n=1 Tax=Candidatus Electronema sp. JC TaxID=3401570 RepID=UPI003B43819D
MVRGQVFVQLQRGVSKQEGLATVYQLALKAAEELAPVLGQPVAGIVLDGSSIWLAQTGIEPAEERNHHSEAPAIEHDFRLCRQP